MMMISIIRIRKKGLREKESFPVSFPLAKLPTVVSKNNPI